MFLPSMEGSRLTGKILRWSSKLAEEGYCNWVKRTQSLLDLVSDRLDSPLPGTVKDFSRTVRNSLLEVEFPPNTISGGRLGLHRILKEEPVFVILSVTDSLRLVHIHRP